MSYTYELHESINLHVDGRIKLEDARRQDITARIILQRLEHRPGLILADEVGMGKTFVALAVAASVALQERQRRPVVVMVPPSLKEKWPKDFQVFKERCVRSEIAKRHLTAKIADNAIQFLKLLDDAPATRTSIIFLTHGAMSPYRKLQVRWVKLAIIQKALYNRQHVKKIRSAVCRYMGELLRIKKWVRKNDQIWEKLLTTHPSGWLHLLTAYDMTPPDNDDPVPKAVLDAMDQMDFYALYATLRDQIPYRNSPNIEQRLQFARAAINGKIVELWDHCIRSLKIRLPLLVLDEAHHLKNAHTQLASLFHSEDAIADAAELSRGPLAEVFERMLFLTATPFQLGHYELCSVLERFAGIWWKSSSRPSVGRDQFILDLKTIRTRLDAAQEAAVRLDYQWGQLKQDDFSNEGTPIIPNDEWWQKLKQDSAALPNVALILDRHNVTKKRMQAAEEMLRPYLIRHSRPKTLPQPFTQQLRRMNFAGRGICDHKSGAFCPGLEIDGAALLPFLLAARITALRPDKRPVFAEGLASSYDAFLHTRQQRLSTAAEKLSGYISDSDDDVRLTLEHDQTVNWYLDQLQHCLSKNRSNSQEQHPKIAATVERVVKLWQAGEKVLVFCHYLATGSALRRAIDAALDFEINSTAAKGLGCSVSQAADQLEKIGQRFFVEDSPIRRGINRAVEGILNQYGALAEHNESILRIVRRYLRTPSFLARYFPLSSERLKEEVVYQAFQREDASGMSLERLLSDFFKFLVEHCGADERWRYIDALENIQTGSKVRLANGTTDQQTRQRLMLTFNTPFYPEVLVASMIMAEGVDLHLNCRHVIHHDLCWNPSTLEQRTGRIDRIGAKVERCGQPIHVYLPYIGQTQDEKMYRVVMDRERWFKVVMGESYKVDARTTEKLAERIPFPEAAANELTFDFRVYSG